MQEHAISTEGPDSATPRTAGAARTIPIRGPGVAVTGPRGIIAVVQNPLEVEPEERAPFLHRLITLLVVVVPFIGLAAAIYLLWGHGVSWLYVALMVGGYMITGVGITVGFHRLFTHKSFKTSPVMSGILAILGSMAVQGPVIYWSATHRRHHQHSDRPDDPHSPHGHGDGIAAIFRGFFHAHLGWLFEPTAPDLDRYVPDLQADRQLRIISTLFPLWAVLGMIIPAAIGLAATGTWAGALLGFIWGGLIRMLVVHHLTWSINSVCHLWGTREYRTSDHSRNNPIFGVLGLGEGWHNNHHAFPASARHGLRWWQFDLGYIVIRSLVLLRLATDMRVPSAALRAARAAPHRDAA